MHEFVQEQVRNLLFGVGFGVLALASHPPQWASHILLLLVVSGVVLVASASFVGISGEQPRGGGW